MKRNTIQDENDKTSSRMENSIIKEVCQLSFSSDTGNRTPGSTVRASDVDHYTISDYGLLVGGLDHLGCSAGAFIGHK